MGDDWSMDLWDELVKNKPEHWDIRDALKHGKNQGQEDQSSRKAKPQHEESPNEAKCGTVEPRAAPGDCKKQVFIGAREWEGHDLNLAVERGPLY